MKVFVGWPYEAEWVEEYVIPLLGTYGIEVLTGKELEGREIQPAVLEKMTGIDAALFFLTRRGRAISAGQYKTSDWVVNEMSHAHSMKLNTIIEIKEEGVVDYVNKLFAERQRITVDPTDRMRLLIRLAKIFNRWRGQRIKVKLVPSIAPSVPVDMQHKLMDGFRSDLLYRLMQKDRYECTYSIRRQNEIQHGPKNVEVFSEGDDFYIYTDELSNDFLSQSDLHLTVDLRMGDHVWYCRGVRLNVLEVSLIDFHPSQTKPDGAP